jgi:hypothetical protein
MEEELKKAKAIIKDQFQEICRQDALILDLYDQLVQGGRS